MGCQASKEDTKPSTFTAVGQTERLVSRADRLQQKKEAAPPPPKLDASGQLMPEEIAKRTTSSILNKVISVGTEENIVKIEYAHWTQRGYYPDDVHKENQDDYAICLQYAGEENGCLMAVFDGHGKKGHECAKFAKQKLPTSIDKYVRQERVRLYKEELQQQGQKVTALFDPSKWPLLDKETYMGCCRKGFQECNKEMHASKKVEDKLSGTTAITSHFHGNMLTICNVGDSRAVLGHYVNPERRADEEEKNEVGEGDTNAAPNGSKHFPGQLLAIPLSRDQTPYRKDERERVKALGAAIMSIDQMEGKEDMHENWGDMVLGEDVQMAMLDPPRVWVQGKDYPGTAFTRSLGDSLAEDIGVTAEPEMLSTELTSNDHLLIIASDGIFEFLTNQEAVDMCTTCATSIQACEKLVKASYDQWLTYENRTDDITVIICFITCQRKPSEETQSATTEALVELSQSTYGCKPIRKAGRGKPGRGSMRLDSGDIDLGSVVTDPEVTD